MFFIAWKFIKFDYYKTILNLAIKKTCQLDALKIKEDMVKK